MRLTLHIVKKLAQDPLYFIEYALRTLQLAIRKKIWGVKHPEFQTNQRGIIKVPWLMGDFDISMYISLSTINGRYIYFNGIYEPKEISIVRKILDHKYVAFDIGANQGLYTLILAKRCKEVHSFEPFPQTFNILSRNIAMNGFENVHANQIGLFDKTGKMEFQLFDDSGLNTLAKRLDLRPLGSIEVGLSTLDEYCDTSKIERLDFIKMDAEFSEFYILKGGLQCIAKHLPIILVEQGENDLLDERFWLAAKSSRSFLKDLGYTFWEAADCGEFPMDFRLIPDSGTRNNLFAVHKEQIEDLKAKSAFLRH
jgi:FkbM family methyltransferase